MQDRQLEICLQQFRPAIEMLMLDLLMLVQIEGLWRLAYEDQDISYICVSVEKLNQLQSRGCKRLLIDLLIELWSEFILFLNLKTEVF